MSISETELFVVFCTCPPDEATALARELVTRHLVACVNIVPGLQSVYRWEGALVEDVESLLIIKVSATNLSTLKEVLPSLHPYTTPELIALPITDGLPAYIQWALNQSQGLS